MLQLLPPLQVTLLSKDMHLLQEHTSKQPIRTRYLGHVTGYQPIRAPVPVSLSPVTESRPKDAGNGADYLIND